MQRHPVIWTAPEPLWAEASVVGNGPSEKMRAPSILRFATDDFMAEFYQVLATDPRRMGEYRLVKETWRGVLKQAPPTPPKPLFALAFQRLGAARIRRNGTASPSLGAKPSATSDAANVPLKIYQPAHQRFYLVSGCLVCQLAGLPDRAVDAGKQEQAGFVVRRFLPANADPQNPPAFDAESWDECAWVASGGAPKWVKLEDPNAVLEGEEVLPMFAVNYSQDDRRSRRIFGGLVPAGKREAYLAAPRAEASASSGSKITARKILLRQQVIEPWKNLVERAAFQKASIEEVVDSKSVVANDAPGLVRARLDSREQCQVVSWYLLLDLAKYLQLYLNDVWRHVSGAGAPALTDPAREALRALERTVLGANTKTALNGIRNPAHQIPDNLMLALRAVAQTGVPERLEGVAAPFHHADNPVEWPTFLFPLADIQYPEETAVPDTATVAPIPDTPEASELTFGTTVPELIDKLAALLVRALPPDTDQPQPAIPLAASAPAGALNGWFALRCVYRRPGCGPLRQDVVSHRTEAFQIAGFFDPDAPARPIRIGLPIDTTPAGLRKFDKNTAFVMSSTLCGQIKRMKGVTFGDLIRSVLPWPLHKELSVPDGGPCADAGGGLGTICSLSIPIITLCALIVLIIMVALLDLIFRWMPFFMLCFPVKGLDAKKS